MKALPISALVAGAVVATVALLPSSNWVFKNQADLLLRSDTDTFTHFGDQFEVFGPKWLLDPDTYKGANEDEQLAHALLQDYSKRLTALKSFAESHPKNALAWAVIVRRAAMRGSQVPESRDDGTAAQQRSSGHLFDIGIEASLKGEALEPDNAYYPLMRAAFSLDDGRIHEMGISLQDAASKTSFDNHVRDEGEALNRALVSAKGYRGELVFIAMESAIMLPDLSHVRSMARYLNRYGSMSEKRDLIQTSMLQANGEQSAIGLIVAFSELRLLLREPLPLRTTTESKLSDQKYLTLAGTFDERLKSAKVAPPVPGTSAIYRTLSRLYSATQSYIPKQPAIFATQRNSDTSLELRIFLQTVGPYWAMFSLVGAVLIGAFASLFARAKSPVFIEMLPHLLCIPASFVFLSVIQPCGGCSSTPYAGAVLGVAQLSLAFLRLGKRPATILTLFIAVMGIVVVSLSSLVLDLLAIGAVAVCVLVSAVAWLLSPEQRERTAKFGGAILAIGGILAIFWDGSGAIGGVLYFVALGLLQRNTAGESPKGIIVTAITLSVITTACIGALIAWQVLSYRPIPGFELGGLAAVLAATIFAGKPLRSVSTSVSISLLLFSGLYLGLVGWELRGNHEIAVATRSFLNEADNIRALAGVKTPFRA